ncbi:hypothetical protein V8C86DRAFT_2829087, partial [Haematococcus lacustris]
MNIDTPAKALEKKLVLGISTVIVTAAASTGSVTEVVVVKLATAVPGLPREIGFDSWVLTVRPGGAGAGSTRVEK